MSEEAPPPFITENDRSLGLTNSVVLVRPDLLRVLGRGLKKLYAPVVQEEVPNHLAQLVEELDLPKGEPPRRS